MPRIPTYTSNENPALGDFGGAEAARINGAGVYGAIGEGLTKAGEVIRRWNEHKENSKLGADASALHAGLTNQWEELKRSADVTDPAVVQKFHDDADDAIGKLGDDIGSTTVKDRYTDIAATLRAAFSIKTASDVATAEGEQAVANAKHIMDNFSNAVAQDPHSLDETLALDKFMLNGLGLSHKQSADLHQAHGNEFAKAAIYGLAERGNTTKARELLNSEDLNDYLDASQKETLTSHLDTVDRVAKAATRADAEEQRRQEHDTAEQLANQIAVSRVDPKTGEERVTPEYFQDLARYSLLPGAQTGTVDALQAAGERIMKKTAGESDPSTVHDFLNRVWAKADDPAKLTLTDVDAAFGAHLLSKADHTMLRQSVMDAAKDPDKAINMREFNDALAGFKSYLSKSSLLTTDADGDSRYHLFQVDKTEQFRQRLREGAKPAALLDPRGSDYIFKDAQRYRPPYDLSRFQDQASGKNLAPLGPPAIAPWANVPGYTQAPVNSAAPAKPKETPDEYLKRVQ